MSGVVGLLYLSFFALPFSLSFPPLSCLVFTGKFLSFDLVANASDKESEPLSE